MTQGIPMNAEEIYQQAIAAYRSGRYAEAEALCGVILQSQPDHFDALHLSSICRSEQKDFTQALQLLKHALAVNPRAANAHNSLGNLYEDLGRPDDALVSYTEAVTLKPDFAAAWFNRGNVFLKLGRPEEAVSSYERALALEPANAFAWYNCGFALNGLGRLAEALASYDEALRLNPGSLEIHTNRGNVLKELKRFEEALVSYDRALAIDPDYAGNYINKGTALFELKRFDEALVNYDKALAMTPDQPYLLGSWLHTKMFLCDWAGFAEAVKKLVLATERGEQATPPFALLAIASSAALQLQCAKSYASDKFPSNQQPIWCGERYAHDRIRVGYFSSDYRNHPMAQLAAGLFESHDRSRFEIIAFAFGGPSDSPIRKRIERSFDRFIDVSAYTDQEIAEWVRSLEIDIAVDLNGFTTNARTGIFAMRPAPVQVNYMGYPGSMGASYMDYIIADPMLVPQQDQRYYTERVVYLPHSYQVNDAAKQISERRFSRSELGLPDDSFVFCCFNNNYKITPDVFDIWMRLLKMVSGSVLWLLEGNATAAKNLRLEATKRGISPDRLVFAPRVSVLEDHLARHRQADLFLDTFYYNAHTTTSDALWAGLPVLTCLGNTFASRVAASLLNAIGLPELITFSRQEYEALALALAGNRDRLATIKEKLARNRAAYPLFNTALFTKHIEAAYSAMWERYQKGSPVEEIYIET